MKRTVWNYDLGFGIMDKIQLQDRTKNFAIRVFRMAEYLPKSRGIEVIADLDIIDRKLLENLLKEADELVAIFTAAIKTSKRNHKS